MDQRQVDDILARLNLTKENDLYKEYIKEYYQVYEIVAGKSVLDIGPYTGIASEIYSAYGPSSVTLVEPNDHILSYEFNKGKNIIIDDIFMILEKPFKADVVICFGVLYHFHSPFYFLELLANRVDPDYILLETYNNGMDRLHLSEEFDNTPGQRYVRNGWKSARCALHLPQHYIDSALNRLGYKSYYTRTYHEKYKFISKDRATLTCYKKKELFTQAI